MESSGTRSKAAFFFAAGLIIVFAAYISLSHLIGLKLFAHSPYDSYTLQAMTWRSGRISLDQDYPWLEIAEYNGSRYISFPPFPTLPMLLLSFIFGENTPSQMVSFAMVLLSYVGGYILARKHGAAPAFAALAAVFLIMGCNMAEVALYGGVWNVAQSMGFCLTVFAFALAADQRRRSRHISLIAIACAVGCRPFQALYVPVLLYLMGRQVYAENSNKKAFFLEMLKLILVPLIIALAYGGYNYIRFGNPLEFGHNYLPEHTTQTTYGQFSAAYIGHNLPNIFSLPWFEDGWLVFSNGGFAFYMTNTMFIIFAYTFILAFLRQKATVIEIFTITAALLHFVILLSHSTMGGVQFGTRYLCDLIPGLFFYWTLRRGASRPEHAVSAFLMLFGLAFNLYGAWCYHVVMGM